MSTENILTWNCCKQENDLAFGDAGLFQTGDPASAQGGLDKGIHMLRMVLISYSMQPCEHARTEILARRDGVDYVRCLGCDQVFEAEDLEAVPAFDEDDQPAA